MEIHAWSSMSKRLFKIVIVATVYFVLGKLGLLLAIPPGVATAVWLPSGVAVAAVLLWGYWMGTGIWLGSFFVNIGTLFDHTGTWSAVVSVCVAVVIGVGSTLQAVFGAYLIQSVIGSTYPFDKVKNVVIFVGLVIVSCLAAPTIGTISLVFGNLISWSAYPITWMTWWLGDLVGILLVVPFFLISEKELWSQWNNRRLLEGLLFLILLFVVNQIAVAGAARQLTLEPSAYLTIPFILLAAFRFGQVGVAASILVILSTAIFGISRGVGPFAHESLNQSLLSLQIYISIILMTGLVLAAALNERKYIEKYLTTQYRVARILTRSGTIQEVVGEILQTICEELGWHYGGFWRADDKTGVLRCVTIWHVPSAQFLGFKDASRKTEFSPGVGLPGRVLHSGQSAWVIDLKRDANFPRAPFAIKEGLRSACAFPILKEKEVTGVMEFFSFHEKQPNEDILHLMVSIGDKITRFMEYRKNVEIMQESEVRNRAIIESALDCIITTNQAGEIIEFNPAAEKMFGYTRAKIIGKQIVETIMPDRLREDYYQGLKSYLATGRNPLLNRRIEIPVLHSDGTEFPVELSTTRVLIKNGFLFTVFLKDISEQKRAEETIRVLSTPVLQVRRGLLILPLIGSMDNQRVDQLREQLLGGIRMHRARIVVMDITGIALIDVGNVKRILDIVAAARLMGARVILTGMSESFSEALLSANIRLDTVISVGDLQRGIEEADRMINSDEMISAGRDRISF